MKQPNEIPITTSCQGVARSDEDIAAEMRAYSFGRRMVLYQITPKKDFFSNQALGVVISTDVADFFLADILPHTHKEFMANISQMI